MCLRVLFIVIMIYAFLDKIILYYGFKIPSIIYWQTLLPLRFCGLMPSQSLISQSSICFVTFKEIIFTNLDIVVDYNKLYYKVSLKFTLKITIMLLLRHRLFKKYFIQLPIVSYFGLKKKTIILMKFRVDTFNRHRIYIYK